MSAQNVWGQSEAVANYLTAHSKSKRPRVVSYQVTDRQLDYYFRNSLWLLAALQAYPSKKVHNGIVK